MDPKQCFLCPRKCGTDRTQNAGVCGGEDHIKVARAALHFGEEPCISGSNGSGTVFFSGCALRCRFCQNDLISHNGFGKVVSENRLAEIFLELQEQGAHNINLVTPSHYAPWISRSLRSVKQKLRIPVAVNCSGYESMEILSEFDGLADIYIPDLKYFSSARSLRYSDVEDYFSVASAALLEMFRQVGACSFSEDGLMKKGLLIRHLMLPGGKEDSEALLRWIGSTFSSKEIWVSIMRQYTPCGDLSLYPEINRPVFSLEFSRLLSVVQELGLQGYCQGRGCNNLQLRPIFDLTGI